MEDKKLNTEDTATKRYIKMCELAGLRHPGQHARVLSPKYYGHESEILAINWSSGEVLMKRPTKGNYPILNGERWWDIALVMILDPEYGQIPELDHTQMSAHNPADRPLADLEYSQVSDNLPDIPEPEIASTPTVAQPPSWIPKRIS